MGLLDLDQSVPIIGQTEPLLITSFFVHQDDTISKITLTMPAEWKTSIDNGDPVLLPAALTYRGALYVLEPRLYPTTYVQTPVFPVSPDPEGT